MDNLEYLSNELRKLGLDKREAQAYLTLLGTSDLTAAQIAQQLKISRPTAYRVLKTLEKKELVSSLEKNSRTVFLASSPDRFLRILKVRRRQVEEQEREFLRIISILHSKHHLLSNENEIKVYSKEEQKLILDDLSFTHTPEIKVIFAGTNLAEIKKLEKIYKQIRKRKSSIKIKEIFTKKMPASSLKYVERKTVSQLPPIPSRVLVISDKVLLLGKNTSLLIEKTKLKQWFELLFEIAWEKC